MAELWDITAIIQELDVNEGDNSLSADQRTLVIKLTTEFNNIPSSERGPNAPRSRMVTEIPSFFVLLLSTHAE